MNEDRNIKMSLETARKMWNEKDELVCAWLLENFTKQELEGKKGITWEEAFTGDGWFILGDSKVIEINECSTVDKNKNIHLTEAHAKASLAFAQLSYIVNKANEGKERQGVTYTVLRENNDLVGNSQIVSRHQLEFYTAEDRNISMVENKELWEDYHMMVKK